MHLFFTVERKRKGLQLAISELFTGASSLFRHSGRVIDTLLGTQEQ